MRPGGTPRRGVVLAALVILGTVGTVARAGDDRPADFTSLSLEQLMETEVTSVSKKSERLLDTPAAVYVITAEDIRRSGATTIPEVLRMVPGLEVARTGAHTWEISARGFRYRMANKFLVLVDGRPVYSPVYGTVLWEDQDLALEDVERIEVIRGPGATMWGANAVNGVINITTRKAVDTQGTLVRLLTGNEETLDAVVRRGGTAGDHAWWRLTARSFRTDDLVLGTGRPARDGWRGSLVAGRLDWEGRGGGEWSIQAQWQDHSRHVRSLRLSRSYAFSEPVSTRFDASRGWAGLSWTKQTAIGGRWSGRVFVDHGRGASATTVIDRTTIDGVLDYVGPPGGRHQLSWGVGARNNDLEFHGTDIGFGFRPPRRSDQIYSGYLQDDVTLAPGRAHLVVGTKVEYTSASGLEVQPQVRAWWRWSPAWMAWAAVSRAARTPSWLERSIDWIVDVSPWEVPGIGNVLVVYRLRGNPHVGAEHQVAHEAGFRWSPNPRFQLDVSGYWNVYRGLTSFDIPPIEFSMTPIPHGEYTASYSNQARLRFRGIDVLARWRPREGVLWEAWWSWIEGRILESAYESDLRAAQVERDMYLGVNPRHQLHLRASVDLPDGWELDGSIHWTDRLAAGPVASWTRLDLRVGWRSPTRDREWSLVVRNALRRHLEFQYSLDSIQPDPGYVEPAVVSRWTWRF